jgi:HYDIN/CFA65/VesB family protein
MTLRHVIVLSFLLLPAVAVQAAQSNGPRVIFDDAVREAGIVGDGEYGAADFIISNAGRQNLHLKLISKSDGVKSVPPESLDIAPHKKRTIRVDVDTWRVSGDARVDIRYATNDPARPSITLALKINVKSFVSASPGFARYVFVQQERPGTIVQTLFPTDGAPFKVTAVRSPVSWLTVSFRRATDVERVSKLPDPQWRVEMTLLSNAPVGAIEEIVRIDVDHPRQKEVRVPVTGFVRPIFAVTPLAADLGRVKLGQPLAQSAIYIQNFATEGISLSQPTVDVPGLAVTIETVTAGHAYRARVSLTSDAKEGPFAGTITLRTSSTKEEYVEIPIRGEFIR